jgi:hypothetical protein
VVWAIAAMWLMLSVVSLLVLRAEKPGRSLHVLQREIRNDLDTLKEALK